jgi:hypothetical protein
MFDRWSVPNFFVPNFFVGGTPVMWERTVQFYTLKGGYPTSGKSRAYYATAANYAIFGRAMRLCHDYFPGPLHSLGNAKTMVGGYLAGQFAVMGWDPPFAQKLAFTEYGYNGKGPEDSAFATDVWHDLNLVWKGGGTGGGFDWYWMGVNKRDF